MEEFVDHSTIHGLQYLKAPKRWAPVQRQINFFQLKYKEKHLLIQERFSGVSPKQQVSSLQI